jgi:hypothetical protein
MKNTAGELCKKKSLSAFFFSFVSVTLSSIATAHQMVLADHASFEATDNRAI